MYLVYGSGILPYHFGRDLVDVFILPFDRYAGESRQIDDREVRTVSRMHIQHNRIINNILILTTNLIG